MDKTPLIAAIKAHPGVTQYLAIPALKLEPMTRDELERIVARAITKVDRAYLATLENMGGNIPYDFWQSYQDDLRAEISTPVRKYISQSFTNYSDYVDFIDKAGAVSDIDTMMTRAITDSAAGIANTTRQQLQTMVSQGIGADEIIERIAMRFGSGHAEQVAVTEITRAEGYFSEALSARLKEQGMTTTIRWLTSEDERVCPLCGPLDNKFKDASIPKLGGQSWGEKYGSPPAHPNCRCKTIVEVKRSG